MELSELQRLPESRITVEVPMDCDPYQAYLDANRALEESREKHGYITPEALDEYRASIRNLDSHAKDCIALDRSSE